MRHAPLGPRGRYPTWARRAGHRPLVLGHRGARQAAPENTLRAFELAARQGADGVELDVRLAGDGSLVILHDRTLARTTGGRDPRDVERLDRAALDRVDVGEGERPPTLMDALRWARERDQRLDIELKHDVSSRLALLQGVLQALAQERDAGDRLLLSSFDPLLVTALARAQRQVPVAWLVHAGQRWLRSAPGWRAVGASGVNPEAALLTEDYVAPLRARGALVYVWTVNEPAVARTLARLGVDGLISDAPGALLAALTADG